MHSAPTSIASENAHEGGQICECPTRPFGNANDQRIRPMSHSWSIAAAAFHNPNNAEMFLHDPKTGKICWKSNDMTGPFCECTLRRRSARYVIAKERCAADNCRWPCVRFVWPFDLGLFGRAALALTCRSQLLQPAGQRLVRRSDWRRTHAGGRHQRCLLRRDRLVVLRCESRHLTRRVLLYPPCLLAELPPRSVVPVACRACRRSCLQQLQSRRHHP